MQQFCWLFSWFVVVVVAVAVAVVVVVVPLVQFPQKLPATSGARSHVLGRMGTFGLRAACITTGQSRASEQGKNQGPVTAIARWWQLNPRWWYFKIFFYVQPYLGR